MVARLSRWVEVGGFWLAANAGAVNAVSLMGFKHQAVSNLTGSASRLGVSLVGMDAWESWHYLLVLLAFLSGAVLSGVIIDNAVLRLGRRYSLALAIEGGLLLAAMLLLWHGSSAGYLLAAAACGLQNGMVSTYSDAIVRTSHVTGMFTDMGIMLGAWIRGHRLDTRKLRLFLLLIIGFILGGCLGALGFVHLQYTALALPAMGAFTLATLYWVYRYTHT